MNACCAVGRGKILSKVFESVTVSWQQRSGQFMMSTVAKNMSINSDTLDEIIFI